MFSCNKHLDLDDEKRFQLASKWVKEVNDLSWKKPGDKFTIISQPVEISGKHCFNCTLGGVCLGSNCLQKLGMGLIMNLMIIQSCSNVIFFQLSQNPLPQYFSRGMAPRFQDFTSAKTSFRRRTVWRGSRTIKSCCLSNSLKSSFLGFLVLF